MVEPLEDSEEPREGVSLLVRIVVASVSVEHLDESAHEVGEYGNSEHESKSYEQPFKVSFRMQISEANSGQGSEWEVDHLDHGAVTEFVVFKFNLIRLSEMLDIVVSVIEVVELVPIHVIVLQFKTELEKHGEVVASAADEQKQF